MSARSKLRRAAVALGLSAPRRGSGKALAWAAALWAALAWAASQWLPQAVLPAGSAGGLGAAVRVCVLAPLAEEFVFRGVLLALLRPCGRWAVPVQAALFAALHASPAAAGYAFAMGLVLGWAAEQSGSLWPGVVLHTMNNGIVLAGLALAGGGLP